MPDSIQYTQHDSRSAAAMRDVLLSVYQDSYGAAVDLSDPFFTLDAFSDRLSGHLAAPGYRLVLASINDHDVAGYCYGYPWEAGKSLFDRTAEPVDSEYREAAKAGDVLFICEIMVRPHYQRRGIAAALHANYISDRTQQFVCLLVEPRNTPAYTAYKAWGYNQIGTFIPDPSHPYDVMIRPLP